MILIIKTGALGDVVRSSFLFAGICQKYGCDLDLLTSDSGSAVIGSHPSIREVYTDVEKALQHNFYRMVINLEEELPFARLTSRLADQGASVFGYYAVEESIFYSDDSCPYNDMGRLSRLGREAADRLKKENKLSFQQIFCAALKLDHQLKPAVYDSHGKQINSLVTENTIAFCPEAGGTWIGKDLSPKTSIELVSRLRDLELTVLNFADRESAWVGSTDASYVATPSFDELKTKLASCRAIISADSLICHLAYGLDIPTFAFFGPTSAAEIDLPRHSLKITALEERYCSYRKDDVFPSLSVERIWSELESWLLRILK